MLYKKATLSIIGIISLLFFIHAEAVSAQQKCSIRQVTDTSVVTSIARQPRISGDGSLVVFQSNLDLNGGNPDGNDEIWTFSIADGLAQLTDTTGSFSANPTASSDASLVAFGSSADLEPGQNPNNRGVIFISNGVAFDQVTTNVGYQDSVLSGDGSTLFFQSSADLVGQNPDNNTELFSLAVDTEAVAQVTQNGPGGIFEPTVNHDGTKVAFQSDQDPLGSNADNNREIFLWDSASMTLIQVTDTETVSNTRPAISGDGTALLFHSRGDLIPGENADGSVEIFLYETDSGQFEQLTDTPAGFISFNPSPSWDGSRVTFFSNANLSGANSNFNIELWLFDGASYSNVTGASGSSQGIVDSPQISNDGEQIAFSVSYDLTGSNPDGNSEVFLATCSFFADGFEDGSLSAWSVVIPSP